MIEPDPEAAIVREAVAAVRQGNRDAFARIVDLYQRRLFGLALMMTREPASAEDVVQDGFVRAFLHLHAYDMPRPFTLSVFGLRLIPGTDLEKTINAQIAAGELDIEDYRLLKKPDLTLDLTICLVGD